MELGYVKEEDIVLALSTQYGFPYLPLDNYMIEEEVVKLVPPSIARHYMLVPVDKMGELLTVAMVDPLDIAAVDAVKAATGLNVATFISTLSQVRSALDRYYPLR